MNQVGLMFWAVRDTLAEIASMGVTCGQLGIGGDTPLTAEFAAQWKADLAAHQFKIVTCFAAYNGESYADIATVQRTVGFIPPATRAERLARTLELSDFAAALGVDSIACHIGFVPEDRSDPDYQDVRDMVRRVCDYAASHGQTFALETGQEPAHVLLDFLKDCERPNLKVNFDPANMILYGSGEPIPAVELLAPYVISVHAKDGDWPKAEGALGSERPLGQGSVNLPEFVKTLQRIGYTGPLCIEREAEDQTERLADLRAAVPYLRGLV
jgi:sugar phosphate isomerase/epimerase